MEARTLDTITPELHQAKKRAWRKTAKPLKLLSAPGVTRTRGTRIRNPVLYPPELRGHEESLPHHGNNAQVRRGFYRKTGNFAVALPSLLLGFLSWNHGVVKLLPDAFFATRHRFRRPVLAFAVHDGFPGFRVKSASVFIFHSYSGDLPIKMCGRVEGRLSRPRKARVAFRGRLRASGNR